MEKAPDDVSNIHNRFSLTLVNPSSHYFSLAVSLGVAAIISLATYFGYLISNSEEIWYRLPAVVSSFSINTITRYKIYKEKEYSKSLHSSYLEICYGLQLY